MDKAGYTVIRCEITDDRGGRNCDYRQEAGMDSDICQRSTKWRLENLLYEEEYQSSVLDTRTMVASNMYQDSVLDS